VLDESHCTIIIYKKFSNRYKALQLNLRVEHCSPIYVRHQPKMSIYFNIPQVCKRVPRAVGKRLTKIQNPLETTSPPVRL